MNLNRTVDLEERPLSLDAGRRAERLRFRRMIFAEHNGILNNGGTPRKGASALHAEAVANTATATRFMDSIRAKIGDCGLSRKRARGTMTDKTTSHSTKPSKNAGQVHPQGVRRGCKGLKPQQHTQAGYLP